MKQQRCFSSARLLSVGIFFLASLLWPASASANIQLYIESAFVHRKNSNCVVQNLNGVPRFRCPPLTDALCQSITTTCPVSCTDDDGNRANGCGAGSAANGPSINPLEDGSITGAYGNLSNEPHIEFDTPSSASRCLSSVPPNGLSGAAAGSAPLNPGSAIQNVCNSDLFLCATIGYGTGGETAAIAIDEVNFEIFKFQAGSNSLDPASTPPLRTFFIDAPGSLPANTNSSASGPLGPFCVLWDGSVNLNGELGKTNGQYGFRVTVKTNQSGSQAGNIQITAVRAYPSGATRDSSNLVVSQKPIAVDVSNVHVVRSSPTVVGTITAVPAQPYNLTYRLAKDATTFIKITDTAGTTLRTIVPGLPRVGEGTPGTEPPLINGDSWNGRADNGAFLPSGIYLASFHAFARDQYGDDLSEGTTRQIGIDPLQITDIRVAPLLDGATSLAVLDYVLTEPATTFIDIYPPGIQFCATSGLNNVPATADDGNPSNPPKQFLPKFDCAGASVVTPLKRIVEQKNSRTRVISFWDGRDSSGTLLPDGDYVFVMYGAMPSPNGVIFNGSGADRRIWTSQAKSGFLPVIRGFIGISQITPSSTVLGSSPSVAGLPPYIFRYSLSRDALVNIKIFDAAGTTVVKTLVKDEIRPGLFGNSERWEEPIADNGRWVSSGTYLVQLTAADPSYPVKVTTTTAVFPVNPFRITDVQTTPLLNGASDVALISYQLSTNMNLGLNIYPPGTVIANSTTTWPPCSSLTPGLCAQVTDSNGNQLSPLITIRGHRAGRLKITEQWDGRDTNGLMVPDGSYVFTLVAQSSTTPKFFATDRITGSIVVQRGAILFPSFTVNPDIPQLFNSSNTITLHPFTVSYSLTRQSSVTIQILNTSVPPVVVRNLVSGAVRESGLLLQDVWDGRDDRGNFPPAGFYTVRAVAQDLASQLSSPSTAQVTVSFDPIRIYDVAVSPLRLDTGGSSILYQVSEPMKIAIKIYKPNTIFDNAGNPSPPESVSLVKRIVGVKPARTAIEDVWDGTDLRLSMVPDGNYKFKIVGSTDIRAIDDITGNVVNPGALSLDRPLDEIPVVRNGSLDPLGDFERNTFVYPNPASGATATFSIYLPFQGKTTLKIYTIAGDLVFERDFGERAPSFTSDPLSFAWNKTNPSGRAVARGIYYAVVRVEETVGGKNTVQTVKRLLIP
ncbi:MAG: hypothetical protein HY921_09140 [Elusimicrobia bacterium]|nr:hypothetical protein [Elusimicrobiota bacterium]